MIEEHSGNNIGYPEKVREKQIVNSRHFTLFFSYLLISTNRIVGMSRETVCL